MTTTKFYEDNTGHIFAIVLHDIKITNFLDDFEHSKAPVSHIINESINEWNIAPNYDPYCFDGHTLSEMCIDTAMHSTLIASISSRCIELYPEKMGASGRILFKINDL